MSALGGFFGGGGKENSGNSSVTTKTHTNNVDFGGDGNNQNIINFDANFSGGTDSGGDIFDTALGGGSGGGSSSPSIALNLSDHGAIQGGLDLAESALDRVSSLAMQNATSNAALANQASKTGAEKDIDGALKLTGATGLILLSVGGIILYILKRKG